LAPIPSKILRGLAGKTEAAAEKARIPGGLDGRSQISDVVV